MWWPGGRRKRRISTSKRWMCHGLISLCGCWNHRIRSPVQSRWGGFISLPVSSFFKQPTSGSKLYSPLSKSSYLWEDHCHQLSSLKQKTRFYNPSSNQEYQQQKIVKPKHRKQCHCCSKSLVSIVFWHNNKTPSFHMWKRQSVPQNSIINVKLPSATHCRYYIREAPDLPVQSGQQSSIGKIKLQRVITDTISPQCQFEGSMTMNVAHKVSDRLLPDK